MNGNEPERYHPEWLRLREPADGRARARELAASLAGDLAGLPCLVVHDLGCGTGSMGRWLAPLLPGPQHWILHDRDPELLTRAAARAGTTAADGTAVTVETRRTDVTRLTPADLAGARLVTASALLDLLTREEVEALAAACASTGVAALFTLSVVGRVDLTPADPLDDAVTAAFNAHQRRTVGDRRLLGPDAVTAASDSFTRLGAPVEVRPAPWRLGPDDAALLTQWLLGWVGAAREQRPDLDVDDYLARRRAEVADGRLRVVVHHEDLLAQSLLRTLSPLRHVSEGSERSPDDGQEGRP